MAVSEKAPKGAVTACIIVGVVALLAWVIMVPMLTSLTGSDPAGNAMAQGFTAIFIFFVWIMLAVLMLIAWRKGEMPKATPVALLLLVPASCAAALTALELLSHPGTAPYMWPLIVPALVPPLLVAFGFWAVLPSAHAALSAKTATGLFLGGVLVLSIAIVPMLLTRRSAEKAEQAASDKYDAALAAMPQNAPLWGWTPFLNTRNEMRKDEVVKSILKLDRRQSEAEVMLERGDFPIGYLTRFDLEPTPAICEKSRVLLRNRAAALSSKRASLQQYGQDGDPISEALSAISWLVGYGCASDAEFQAWESIAILYNRNYDGRRLGELRDPKLLGRTLREDPSRFSMLTPEAHLKAWLKFADNEVLREQALAGARKLSHRTVDAVDMLNSEYTAFPALQYLPVLDLEATPALCAAALKALRLAFDRIYKPSVDDPRPYSE